MIRMAMPNKTQSRASSKFDSGFAVATGCLFVLLIFAQGARAQVSAAISGRVNDPSGAAGSCAGATAKNLETEAVRTTSTDDAGRYWVPSLALGEYEIRVTKPSFRE